MNPLWLFESPLVLASKSAVRRAIIEAAGIPVEIRIANIDERGIEAKASARSPQDVALLLAQHKAEAVSKIMPGRLVVGADQTLALGEKRFTKPTDRASARNQLLEMRARTHELHSGIALMRDGILLYGDCDTARLTMRDFSAEFADRYLDAAGSSVYDSVGGYQLERTGIQLFDRVDGDHNTILGLPILGLLNALRKAGALVE
jgi:septum formation protein